MIKVTRATLITRFLRAPKKILASVWLFPIILLIFLFSLSAFRISGTSIGIYYKIFYGAEAKDPSLLFGAPQPIRSDEWLVNTQLQMAQEANEFQRFNENIGTGKDMSFHLDVPVKDWSAIFKAQDLVFLILPFENAFAFKWWFMLVLLMTGGYFFTLRLFPKKRLLAALAASGFALSPFIHWWYLNGTIAPLLYGFFILIVGMRILNAEPLRFIKPSRKFLTNSLYCLLLAYLLVSFALIIYPPFQIPVVLAIAFYLTGYFLQKGFSEKLNTKLLLKRLAIFFVAALIAGVTVVLFVSSRSEVYERISNTIYPGQRIVAGGSLKPELILTTYLQPQLQRASKAANFYHNQSEASNFILIMPFLLLPGFYLLVRDYSKKRKIDWILLLLQLGSLLFLARIFVPVGDVFYKLLMLHQVPNERLIIGLGFIGFLQMLHIMKRWQELKIDTLRKHVPVAAYAFLCFIILALLGYAVRHDYPKFISSVHYIILGSLVISSIVYFILLNKRVVSMTILLVFSFLCVFHINPLYKGMGPIYRNRISSEIKSVSKEQDTWVFLDFIYFENLGLLNDRDSLSGVHFYPDVEYWRALVGEKGDHIHNRYAHVQFSTSPELTEKMVLVQPDQFVVKFECSPFIVNEVEYVLTHYQLTNECVSKVDEIVYPGGQFFIYKLVK